MPPLLPPSLAITLPLPPPAPQDWLNVVWQGLPAQTKGNITAANDWLDSMAQAATELDITIQMCMPLPAHILHSTGSQAVVSSWLAHCGSAPAVMPPAACCSWACARAGRFHRRLCPARPHTHARSLAHSPVCRPTPARPAITTPAQTTGRWACPPSFTGRWASTPQRTTIGPQRRSPGTRKCSSTVI